MITTRKAFTLHRATLASKFRVENNNLDLSPLISSTGYTVGRLGDLAPSHRKERNKRETAHVSFKYVQISDVDVSLGVIKSFRRFKGDAAPNNARRVMKTGDILVSTRRPTRGAVAVVPKEFDGDICTVFFTTLTVKDWNVLDPRYLVLFLRSSLGRVQFQSQITETAYPVISDADVESITVLYPGIEEQRRIADGYRLSVRSFFDSLNSAYASITAAQQTVEDFVLGEYRETVPVRSINMVSELELSESDVTNESGASSSTTDAESQNDDAQQSLGLAP